MRKLIVFLVFCSLLVSVLVADDIIPAKKEVEFTPVPMNPDNYFSIIRPAEPFKEAPELPTETVAPANRKNPATGTDLSAPAKPVKQKKIPDSGESGNLRIDPDTYEPDNSVTQYQYINVYTSSFTTQSHSLHNNTDQDWYRFNGYVGYKYVFYTLLSLDTIGYIYDDTGTTLLASNDDGGPDLNFYIEFTPPTNGSYKLKIVGYGGQTGYYDIRFTRGIPPDDYEDDDTSSTYAYLSPTSNLTTHVLTLDSSTDEDWRLFFAAAGVEYYFISEGNTDTRIYCYDQAMTQLIAWDDDSGDNTNFSLTVTVPVSGYYLLRINGYNGAMGFYRFNYYAYCNPDAYEPNNVHTSATNISPGTAITSLDLTLNTSQDQDWFRFYATPGRIYRFSSAGTTDTIAELYMDDGVTLLASNDDGGGYPNFSLNYEVPANGYYKLKIYGYAGILGAYTLQYSYGQDPDIYEPDDTHLTATELYNFSPFVNAQEHTIHVGTDQDWFKFEAIPGRIYTFYSTGNLDTVIELYAEDGVTLLASNDDYTDTNFYLEFTSPTTAYYKFRVYTYLSFGVGTYQLNYLYGADPDIYEPNDTYALAILLNPTTTVQTLYNTLHVNTDQDWFKFYAYAGNSYTFYSYGNTDVQASLYASDHTTQIAYDDDGAGYPNFIFQYYSSTSGWLYLKVSGFTTSVGAYDLNFYSTAGLAAPSFLNIYRSGSSITLDWPNMYGATAYRVEGSDSPISGFTPLITTDNSYWNTTASSTRKFYRVIAIF